MASYGDWDNVQVIPVVRDGTDEWDMSDEYDENEWDDKAYERDMMAFERYLDMLY